MKDEIAEAIITYRREDGTTFDTLRFTGQPLRPVMAACRYTCNTDPSAIAWKIRIRDRQTNETLATYTMPVYEP